MFKLAAAAILVIGLLSATAVAQKPAAPDTPPDRKAYTEAVKIQDPNARITALEKMIADFPKSERLGQARMAILDALLEQSPKDENRIRSGAKLAIGKSKDWYTFNSVAGKLADAGAALEDAEKNANRAVSSFKLKDFLSDERRGYSKRKQAPPAEEVLAKRFRAQRAGPLATLGRVYLKQGQPEKAETLLKEAFADNPSSSATPAALAEIAEKRGDDKAALDFSIQARLAPGRMPAGTVERLQALYRKQHSGSLDGLEDLLDRTYEKLYPNPIPASQRTDRVVLVEVFTGAGCPPCVAADLAFDVVLERYPRTEVALIMNHQHIPRPDPLTNPATTARGKAIDLQGVPTFLIDGKKTGGGGPREYAPEGWQKIQAEIEKSLAAPAEAQIALEATRSGAAVTVHATVNKVKEGVGPLTLQVALVERKLRYSGENGIRFHPMVVRAYAGPDAAGFTVDPSKPGAFDVTFDIEKIAAGLKAHLDDFEVNNTRFGRIKFIEKKDEIDRANLAVVAFVHDGKNRVLQSIYRKVE